MNLSKKQNIKVWWVIPSSGILIGLNAPGVLGNEWVGFISLIPLVWLLEKTFLNPNLSQKKKLFPKSSILFGFSAGIGSSIGAFWITHSAHVFGHLPGLGLSHNFIGYGLEVGLLLWIAWLVHW
ncbi:MAG: hypothetical protein Ct9H90mP8_0220 [Pseudomonadota bacterium]|nr:MAG: hypothetical protein Ct9H90mP8_0220 [Pseudomonadota bacterium]